MKLLGNLPPLYCTSTHTHTPSHQPTLLITSFCDSIPCPHTLYYHKTDRSTINPCPHLDGQLHVIQELEAAIGAAGRLLGSCHHCIGQVQRAGASQCMVPCHHCSFSTCLCKVYAEAYYVCKATSLCIILCKGMMHVRV